MNEQHCFDGWLGTFSNVPERGLASTALQATARIVPLRGSKRKRVVEDTAEEILGVARRFFGFGNALAAAAILTNLFHEVTLAMGEQADARRREAWRDMFDQMVLLLEYPPPVVTESAFLPSASLLRDMPVGSWLLSLTVTLAQPFTSKAELDYHYSNNPIGRDRLSGAAIVYPSTWKGHMRYAAQMEQTPSPILIRLFGDGSEADSQGRAGRLRFFPTFWDQKVSAEVVTPLQRATRTPVQGRGPIDIEVVPKATRGIFCLMYLPRPKGRDWSVEQPAEEMPVAARAVSAMLSEYGFSAKKTSGWGIVRDDLESGSLTIRARGGTLRTRAVARISELEAAALATIAELRGTSAGA